MKTSFVKFLNCKCKVQSLLLEVWIYRLQNSRAFQKVKFSLHFPGQSEVIGSAQPIIASPGDDVILPCHLDPEFNVQGLTVEWSKPDLKPDPSDRLSRVAYVHLYRHRQEVPDMKIPAYLSRTELFTDELERGNISLKIMNVTLADEGRYRCLVPKLKSSVKFAIVRLVIVGEFLQMLLMVQDLSFLDLLILTCVSKNYMIEYFLYTFCQ